MTKMILKPKITTSIEKDFYSNYIQFKRKMGSLENYFYLVQITNLLTDLCFILAVFKYKYFKIAAT